MATDSTSASRDPARPSSSTSDLFAGLYARGAVSAEVDGRAWLQAMLDVEAALARATAPPEAAAAIAAACRAERFDLDEIARGGAETASPVVALLRALREALPDDVAEHAHRGATSQDIVDSAAMLVAQRALGPLAADAGAAADAAARLADEHRDTVMPGRTLLQQALPISFGLKAAGWMSGIDEALAGLLTVRPAVQMGGPVGDRDPALAEQVAGDLGLAVPLLPWHTNRVRVAALAAALGTLAGSLGKVGRDVVLLAQDEVGEVEEGGHPERGGSSAMPHKRNPVAAVSIAACVERTPGLVATMLAAMVQEHERAAGAWQAEWGTLTDLLRLTGSAAAWARDLLEGLVVHAERMSDNAAGMTARAELGATRELIDRALAAHGSMAKEAR